MQQSQVKSFPTLQNCTNQYPACGIDRSRSEKGNLVLLRCRRIKKEGGILLDLSTPKAALCLRPEREPHYTPASFVIRVRLQSMRRQQHFHAY